jgi:hypothetical protein
MKLWDECIEKSDKLVMRGALSVIVYKSDIKLSFAVCQKRNRVTENTLNHSITWHYYSILHISWAGSDNHGFNFLEPDPTVQNHSKLIFVIFKPAARNNSTRLPNPDSDLSGFGRVGIICSALLLNWFLCNFSSLWAIMALDLINIKNKIKMAC